MASATVVITRRIAGHDDTVAEPADAAGHEYVVRAAAARSELVAIFYFSDFFYLSPEMLLSCFLFSDFFIF
jgi:hypothetical protein